MSDFLPVAPPLSRAAIVRIAEQFRQLFGLSNPYLPVERVVELLMPQAMPGYLFEVLDRPTMGERHGYWHPMARELALREDVYERMVAGKGRDRSTAMHEVGHAVLHPGTLNRVMSGSAVASFRNPEWQAQTFAAAAMMPPSMVRACRTVTEVTHEFGVTEPAAEVWLRILNVTLKK